MSDFGDRLHFFNLPGAEIHESPTRAYRRVRYRKVHTKCGWSPASEFMADRVVRSVIRRWARPTHSIERIAVKRTTVSVQEEPQGRDRKALKKEFESHARKWRQETAVLSSSSEKLLHPSYLRIIGLGSSVIPLILRELKSNGGHWFAALEALTGESPDTSVEPGDIRGLSQAWLHWGEKRGYLKLGKSAR